MIFLLEYDPTTSTLVTFKKFDPARKAEAHAAVTEIDIKNMREGRPRRRTFLLDALSERALWYTHGHYFGKVLGKDPKFWTRKHSSKEKRKK